MVWLKTIYSKLKEWVTYPYRRYQQHKEYKKRMQELKERDPFIYK